MKIMELLTEGELTDIVGRATGLDKTSAWQNYNTVGVLKPDQQEKKSSNLKDPTALKKVQQYIATEKPNIQKCFSDAALLKRFNDLMFLADPALKTRRDIVLTPISPSSVTFNYNKYIKVYNNALLKCLSNQTYKNEFVQLMKDASRAP